MTRSYPTQFIRSFPGINESDIEFGLQHGLIQPDNPPRLTHLFPESRIPDVWTIHHETWRTIALKWAIDHFSHDDRSLFDEIDTIYSMFNYPEDMKNIVSYMPGDESSSSASLRRKIYDFYKEKLEQLSGKKDFATD